MVRQADVVVVGNVGVDTMVTLPGGDVDLELEAAFTRNVDGLGHAGGYASRGYAALGLATAFIGHVGDDFCGRFVREVLEGDGIDTRALLLDPTGTARSVNLMARDGRRKAFYDGKAHMTLEPDLALCREVLRGARLAHFNIPHWARRLLPLARELGVPVACDLQDVPGPDDPYRRDFVEAADILFLSGANLPDPAAWMAEVLARRPGITLVCGLGARGAALGTREGIRMVPPVDLPWPVVDTNGAGDSLAVGFLTAHVLEGLPPEAALRRGQIAARHCCTLQGTSDGLLTREGLDRALALLARPRRARKAPAAPGS